MDRRRIDTITDRQLALIAARQFARAGGTTDALKWAVKDKWLEPYRWRGVYRVVGAARLKYQPLMGACLAAGDDAFACGLGAAYLYGAPDIAPALEIGVEGRIVRLEGVTTHMSTLGRPDLVTSRFGVPVVAAPLCVVQVARTHTRLSELVANNLVSRNLTTFGEILLCLEAVDRRGKGSRALRKFLLRELEISGHDDSPAARKLGRALLRAGLPRFETQFFVDTGEGVALLDFAWPRAKVGVEYHGRADHAATRAQIDADARRRGRLAARGWRILDATAGLSHDEVSRWTANALMTCIESAS
ncbi:MAG: hypothetical protein H0W70_13140 [Actinobacteria bacterium]|nr:hypothetical protein [Actinomycetota bacterium]